MSEEITSDLPWYFWLIPVLAIMLFGNLRRQFGSIFHPKGGFRRHQKDTSRRNRFHKSLKSNFRS